MLSAQTGISLRPRGLRLLLTNPHVFFDLCPVPFVNITSLPAAHIEHPSVRPQAAIFRIKIANTWSSSRKSGDQHRFDPVVARFESVCS